MSFDSKGTFGGTSGLGLPGRSPRWDDEVYDLSFDTKGAPPRPYNAASESKGDGKYSAGASSLASVAVGGQGQPPLQPLMPRRPAPSCIGCLSACFSCGLSCLVALLRFIFCCGARAPTTPPERVLTPLEAVRKFHTDWSAQSLSLEAGKGAYDWRSEIIKLPHAAISFGIHHAMEVGKKYANLAQMTPQELFDVVRDNYGEEKFLAGLLAWADLQDAKKREGSNVATGSSAAAFRLETAALAKFKDLSINN
ncbi:MAG: hypothetical protein HYX48_04600 [Chlamydiales bacterium]|nr:hypothetical protein [Chlamydiales bacterium]